MAKEYTRNCTLCGAEIQNARAQSKFCASCARMRKLKSTSESRKRHKYYKSPLNEAKIKNTKRKKSNSMQRINEIVRLAADNGMTYGQYQDKKTGGQNLK